MTDHPYVGPPIQSHDDGLGMEGRSGPQDSFGRLAKFRHEYAIDMRHTGALNHFFEAHAGDRLLSFKRLCGITFGLPETALRFRQVWEHVQQNERGSTLIGQRNRIGQCPDRSFPEIGNE